MLVSMTSSFERILMSFLFLRCPDFTRRLLFPLADSLRPLPPRQDLVVVPLIQRRVLMWRFRPQFPPFTTSLATERTPEATAEKRVGATIGAIAQPTTPAMIGIMKNFFLPQQVCVIALNRRSVKAPKTLIFLRTGPRALLRRDVDEFSF